MFQAKVLARMTSALIQSGGGWLPDIFPESTIEHAVAAAPLGTRILLAKDGEPVIGVPMQSQSLQGLDSLLSIVQMPGGIPVGTMGIGKPGAINAALQTVRMLATTRPELREKLRAFNQEQADKVLRETLP